MTRKPVSCEPTLSSFIPQRHKRLYGFCHLLTSQRETRGNAQASVMSMGDRAIRILSAAVDVLQAPDGGQPVHQRCFSKTCSTEDLRKILVEWTKCEDGEKKLKLMSRRPKNVGACVRHAPRIDVSKIPLCQGDCTKNIELQMIGLYLLLLHSLVS